jgi:hypothetical protein
MFLPFNKNYQIATETTSNCWFMLSKVRFERDCVQSFFRPDVVDHCCTEVKHQLVDPEGWLRGSAKSVEIDQFEKEFRIRKFLVHAVQSDDVSENQIGG